MTVPARRLNRIYRKPELQAFIGVRRTKVAELMENEDFPRPIKLTPGGRAIGWLEDELIAWQQSRIAARDAGEK